ncbi:hypothetical protein [Caulobacter sp.]|uniref:hypothetical protein n=1 Tax=Caulobacter sp. TaxID=78 RepID=UPI002B477EBE|nr:hypothetical protein [Caulobacter sp.]HJV41727.1 hypothetical protein [Caulobacter sp.]
MERLDQIVGRLKAFALTRPVSYGAPVCALVGVLAGLAMKTGPQEGPYEPEMDSVQTRYEAAAEPIAWPAGKVPDYVIGVDFLKTTQAPPVEYAVYEPPPPPDLPPYVPAEHGPATPPPQADAPHWASERGDILDVSLPEDQPRQAAPTVLADAAATGMTTR